MAFQACPGIAMCEVLFTASGVMMENVFHLMKGSEWSAADLEDAWNAFELWIDNDWNDAANTHVACVGFKGTDLSSDSGATFEPTFGDAVPGNIESDALPLNSTVVISWKTALRGRSYRGRTYHVGLPDSFTAGSFMTVPGLAALNTCYTALQGHLVSGGLTMCILSRRHAGVERAEGIGTPITSFTIDGTLDSQRRRLPGRGT